MYSTEDGASAHLQSMLAKELNFLSRQVERGWILEPPGNTRNCPLFVHGEQTHMLFSKITKEYETLKL